MVQQVFITGDRSASPDLAVPIVQQLLLQVFASANGEKVEIFTGGHRGVEQAAEFVARTAGLDLTVVPEQLDKDWSAYALRVRDASNFTGKVYLVHGEPDASKLYQAFSGHFDDERFELVNPSLLFAPAV